MTSKAAVFIGDCFLIFCQRTIIKMTSKKKPLPQSYESKPFLNFKTFLDFVE